jgi:hypothetical protein
VTTNEGAPERVWLIQDQRGVWMKPLMPPSIGCEMYLRADTVTPNEVVEGLVEALREMVKEAQIIRSSRPGLKPHPTTVADAERALSRYEATRQRGGTDEQR